ncbi:MAG: hypothetical protein ACI86H_002273, partial [bacterium]
LSSFRSIGTAKKRTQISISGIQDAHDHFTQKWGHSLLIEMGNLQSLFLDDQALLFKAFESKLNNYKSTLIQRFYILSKVIPLDDSKKQKLLISQKKILASGLRKVIEQLQNKFPT